MTAVNKALLAVLLLIAVTAAWVLLRNQGKRPVQDHGVTVSQGATHAVPTPTATPVGTPGPKHPPLPPITPAPTPAPAAGVAPMDDATQVAVLRQAIMGDDPEKRATALGQTATLLTQGKGIALLNEMVVSGRKDLQDDALSLLPNLPEDPRLPVISLGLEAKDPEFRTDMLTAVRDVISSDPKKEALNDLIIKALKDPDASVQEEGADLFNYFGDAESDGPLYRAASEGLASDNATVRDNAVEYLADNQTVAAVLALTEALKSKYPDIVEKAGDALRFTTDANISSNKYEDWVKWCHDYGTQWGKENDPTLQP